VLGLPVARARPGSVPGAVVVLSVKGGGLPEKRGELARAGDRDDAGGLAPLVVQVRPALVQALLGAPGDLNRAWVLAVLAAGRASRRCAAGTAPRRTPLRPPPRPRPRRSPLAPSHRSHQSCPSPCVARIRRRLRRVGVTRHHPSEVDRRAGPRGAASGLRQDHRDRPPTRCSFPHAQRPRRASRALDAMLTSDPSR